MCADGIDGIVTACWLSSLWEAGACLDVRWESQHRGVMRQSYGEGEREEGTCQGQRTKTISCLSQLTRTQCDPDQISCSDTRTWTSGTACSTPALMWCVKDEDYSAALLQIYSSFVYLSARRSVSQPLLGISSSCVYCNDVHRAPSQTGALRRLYICSFLTSPPSGFRSAEMSIFYYLYNV